MGHVFPFPYRQADVSSFEAVSNLKREVSSKLGPVDILVNNAGVLPLMSLREGTPDDLKKVIEINLLSHLWVGTRCGRVF